MILGMEIGLAIFGLIALVKGKMTVSKNKVVVGAAARLLGLLALTPLPAALLFVVLYAAAQGGQVRLGRNPDGEPRPCHGFSASPARRRRAGSPRSRRPTAAPWSRPPSRRDRAA